MRIVIAGAGQVGTYLAKMLSEYDHDILVIDKDEERLQDVASHYDVMTLVGDSTLVSTLEEAGAPKADLLIAVTSEQNVNILSCIVAKNLGIKTTIARIDSAEYLTSTEKKLYTQIGVDTMIYPERIAAKEIITLLHETAAIEAFNFSDSQLSLLMINIGENAPSLNKSLREITIERKELEYRAVAIKRGLETIMPTGSDMFQPNDKVFVIAKKNGIKELMAFSGNKSLHIENIMILGGTKIGMKAAQELEKKYHVKLIEKDRDKCEKLTGILEQTLVINGSGSDIEALMEESVDNMDAFIAVTSNSEANIFACLLAKKMGVKKTIAMVNNIDYIEMAQNIGIDTIINKKLIAASYIHQFTMDAEVTSSKCLNGVDADVLEFVVKPKAKITKHKIKDLKFPNGAIIGGVIRGSKSFIAVGDTMIEAEDHVVVFAIPSVMHKVEKFFN